jgi:hypothetical protein
VVPMESEAQMMGEQSPMEQSCHDWLLKYQSSFALIERKQESSHEMRQSGCSTETCEWRTNQVEFCLTKAFDAITSLCYNQLFLTIVAPQHQR